MSAGTAPAGLTAEDALSVLPEALRVELVGALGEIARNYAQGRWEPSELNGGKLCEVAYTVLKGHADGRFPARAAKPRNMVDACRALEEAGSSFPRSVRIQIPRMLVALYEIRNNRGVGHVGGDVNPNEMDAVAVLYMAKWVVAELVRIFHAVDTEAAAAVVESLVERTVPVVWEVSGRKRVLAKSLTMKEKTLLLLYSHAGPVSERDLLRWVEHSNATGYRRDVLRPLHRDGLIDYDRETGVVQLSPTGARHVEMSVPLTL